MSITLENATCENTCEYSLTGMYFRSKLLWVMPCNSAYSIVAIEMEDKIHKAYIWGSGTKTKQIGDIFYVKFGKYDHELYSYQYAICDSLGNLIDSTYSDDFFKPEYKNIYI